MSHIMGSLRGGVDLSRNVCIECVNSLKEFGH